MANKQMQYFHELVAQERYREARGVLETEDIDPQVAEKWLAWLDHLHTEERVQVGVLSDKARYDRQQSTIASAQVVGAAVAIVLTLVVMLPLFYKLMTTGTVQGMVFLFLGGIMLGTLGWHRFLRQFAPNHRFELTGVIVFILTMLMMSGGVPFSYYPDGPPAESWLSTVLLQLPFWGYITASIGETVGARIVRFFLPTLEDDKAIASANQRLKGR